MPPSDAPLPYGLTLVSELLGAGEKGGVLVRELNGKLGGVGRGGGPVERNGVVRVPHTSRVREEDRDGS